jgi:peptide/nickel transport system substrate-binding protein
MRTSRTRFGVLTLVVLLLAAACGDATDDVGVGDGSGTTVGSDGGTAAEGGTLRYGAPNLVTRFDAHRSSNGYDQNWLAPVYERLIWQTPEVELVPGLATEWAFVDETTFEMTLREGVTFHDGEPFDAEAVKANIERAINVEGSGLAAYLASIDTVEVVDEYEVRFLLNRPDATLPNQLATRPGMMISPAAFDNPDLDFMPVGTGPFRLVEYRDQDRAIYERNEDYWDAEYTGLDRLEIVYLSDSVTRLNGIRSGQIDATVLDVSQIDEAERLDGIDVSVEDTLEVFHFQMDRTKSEFDEVLVRRAISHAIDREAIVQGLMFGYATPATQWVPPGTPYYVDDLGESSTYDPERARELLAEAGLADGFAAQVMVSVQPIYVQLAEIVADQLSDVGIELEIRQEPQLADAFFVREAADAIVSPYPGRVDLSETVQIYFNDESFSNPGRHVTPEVKEAWFESLRPSDDRDAAMEELARALDDGMLNVPILHPQLGLASTDAVSGLQWYLSGHIEFAGVGVEG